jgi:hypothetical protein
MTARLVNAHGRAAHDPDVKEFFGLDRKAKWPTEGMGARLIQGVLCGVDMLRPGHFRIRAWAECPECGRRMPIGRLNQHWERVHDVERWLTVLRTVDRLTPGELADVDFVMERIAIHATNENLHKPRRAIAKWVSRKAAA